MIPVGKLKKLALGRLKDAQVLAQARRYDGAIYIAGYAVELSLKYLICRTLKWREYPASRAEFENLQSFKTHNLDVLLRLTGRESMVRRKLLAEWSIVSQWNPESRYDVRVRHNRKDASEMLVSVDAILAEIWTL